jgi:hypothetical protein
MDYRWLTSEEVVDLVNPSLAMKQWPQLGTDTSRVLGAWAGDNLVEVFAIQLMPMLGPMLKIDNTHRDGGDVSRELAERMDQYLKQEDARGFLTIAETALTERLCERHGMRKVEWPVYVSVKEN